MMSEHAHKLIAEQRRRYIKSMPEKKAAILQCMAQVNSAVKSGEANLCDKLFQQVHRLAGSAGSYGFDSLGHAASVVDRYLIASSPGPGNLTELTSMLKKLLTEIDEIIRQHGEPV
jgi:HPt (histidine-containing phosphotransfer) domain-containing protein